MNEGMDRERFLSEVLDNFEGPFCIAAPDGSLLLFNRSFTELTGYTREEIWEKPLNWLVDLTPPEWRNHEMAMLDAARRSGQPVRYKKEFVRKADWRTPIELSVHPRFDKWGNLIWYCCYYYFLAGTVESGHAEDEELRHLANHDELTGLPNKRLFNSLLSLELAHSKRHGKKMAIFYLDLDGFKNINDSLGHEAGDELLREVAARLKATVRASDTVARIGGDEFNIIISNVSRAESAAAIARKIIECFRQSFSIAEHELLVTASVGISIYPDDSEEIEALLRFADNAMYHAKKEGRNSYQFYDDGTNVRALERMKLYTALRRAVEQGELTVYYQPQIDVKSRKVTCGEALVRWQHPEMGLLDASAFIPLAEETGFVTSIDEWVLRNVCAQVGKWKDAGLLSVTVTVNVSSRHFGGPVSTRRMLHIIEETAISPGCLHLEISEGIAMNHAGRTAANIQELAARGVHISIDHFGTGCSSINYLKQLPVGRLKIDSSFVRDIATDSDKRAIISAVSAMGYNMRMSVVASGVETEEQLAFLRLVGCSEVQGFLISGPLPTEEFEKLLAAGKTS
jgi:diguanylate cyclase (GGDEF)-like protein/PAS domain S-box-containing protein